MNYKYHSAKQKKAIFLENQTYINERFFETSLVMPVIGYLCENMAIIISNCKFSIGACNFLEKVINDSTTSADYYDYYLQLKQSNQRGVELAKKEYIERYKSKYYMNCEERFDIKFGKKMFDDGNKILDALLNIRRLFEKNIGSIKSILEQENLCNDFKKIIGSDDKVEIYLGLIKNIVKQHISVILNELSKIAEDPSEMTVSKMMSGPKRKLY